VASVNHVFADGIKSVELTPLPGTIYTDVAHGDLLSKVGDEPRGIDEVFRVRDEKGVLCPTYA
jgi:hypothetical protein